MDASFAGWRTGREAWPNLDVSRDEFIARAAGPEPVREPGDLYLAIAMSRHDARALVTLDAMIDQVVTRHLRRFRLGKAERDDLRQELRFSLLFPPSEKLRSFHGRGSLQAWLRVVAVRLVLDKLKRHPPEPDDAGDALLFAAPELVMMKDQLRGPVRQALARALDSLEDDDRELVRFYFGECLSTAAIAVLRGVHKSTVARQLALAQERLRRIIHTQLGATALSGSEVTSAVRKVMSELDGDAP